MSSDTSFEPIEPGSSGPGGLEKLLPWLWLAFWLVVIYLGLAWWRGDPPSWSTVIGVFSLAATAAGFLGWKSSPERRLEKRLRSLFAKGGVPDADEVLGILDGTGDSELRTLTERFALGLVPPELYAREMARLLKMPETSAAP